MQSITPSAIRILYEFAKDVNENKHVIKLSLCKYNKSKACLMKSHEGIGLIYMYNDSYIFVKCVIIFLDFMCKILPCILFLYSLSS